MESPRPERHLGGKLATILSEFNSLATVVSSYLIILNLVLGTYALLENLMPHEMYIFSSSVLRDMLVTRVNCPYCLLHFEKAISLI
jgi:hypothetical protein